MANQMTITFNVENQILSRTDTNRIVEKAKNYLFAEFTFSEDWNNTNKAIIFENNVLRYKIYLDSDNKCQVPNRIIRNDGFTISVIGENDENLVTITTSELYIGVGKSNATDEEMESIYEITSQSLDVNKNGGTCNLEIKDEYKFYYEMQENDFSNMVSEGGSTWSLDLSEALENVITEFKKRIGVDWVALGLTPPVPSATKCVYSPTKKIVFVGDEEITYYLFSAVDSVGDTSVHFYYENNSWHVVFMSGNLVDRESMEMRLYEKQDVLQAGEGIDISGNEISTDRSKVVANPTLSGDEPDLEGAEIDGIKYKVGGGKLYMHLIEFSISGSIYSNLWIELFSSSATPMVYNDLVAKGVNNIPCCSRMSSGQTFMATRFGALSGELFIGGVYVNNGALAERYDRINSSNATLTDTVTEV